MVDCKFGCEAIRRDEMMQQLHHFILLCEIVFDFHSHVAEVMDKPNKMLHKLCSTCWLIHWDMIWICQLTAKKETQLKKEQFNALHN